MENSAKTKQCCSPSRYDDISESSISGTGVKEVPTVSLIAGAASPPRGDARDYENQSSSDCN